MLYDVTITLPNGTTAKVAQMHATDLRDFGIEVETPQRAALDNSSEMRRSVGPLVRGNDRIGAIKLVRTLTGWGLKEAKGWVDTEFPR